jgi:hypothetical protein
MYHFLDHDKNTQEWYALDNALFEIGADGQTVSVLTKSYQGIQTLGTSIDEYVHIFYGKSVGRHIENSIPNSWFSETYVRDIRPVAAAAVVAPPAAPAPTKPVAEKVLAAAASTCSANEVMVRYTGNMSKSDFKQEAPKVGKLKCWDNQGQE